MQPRCLWKGGEGAAVIEDEQANELAAVAGSRFAEAVQALAAGNSCDSFLSQSMSMLQKVGVLESVHHTGAKSTLLNYNFSEERYTWCTKSACFLHQHPFQD